MERDLCIWKETSQRDPPTRNDDADNGDWCLHYHRILLERDISKRSTDLRWWCICYHHQTRWLVMQRWCIWQHCTDDADGNIHLCLHHHHIHLCDVTSHVRNDTFICDMTHSYVKCLIRTWHGSIIRDMTHSYVWFRPTACGWRCCKGNLTSSTRSACSCLNACAKIKSSTFGSDLRPVLSLHMYDVTHSYV